MHENVHIWQVQRIAFPMGRRTSAFACVPPEEGRQEEVFRLSKETAVKHHELLA